MMQIELPVCAKSSGDAPGDAHDSRNVSLVESNWHQYLILGSNNTIF